jgi:hypothetical protein
MAKATKNPSGPEKPEKIRDDLMRRLFAVAISVGAANTLVEMPWVRQARAPEFWEWQQLVILVVAMTATVLSWDGYLRSISDRPLTSYFRFAIDITLVFLYMFLLITSKHLTWWLTIHAITFLLYFIWDFLTVRDYTAKYYPKNAKGAKTIAGVYWNGIRDVSIESRGPIITIAWAAYFWLLVILNSGILIERILVTSIFALLGLRLYRHDKQVRYSMFRRLATVAALLVIDFLIIRYGGAFFTDRYLWGLIH